ncbi:extensin family protein [Pendulispora rubella]|uniref:Extensin family protein n=1 Tax=Pendulispora rubella TaxID=2741070 RepID=A0ABZ2LGH0_9BACT
MQKLRWVGLVSAVLATLVAGEGDAKGDGPAKPAGFANADPADDMIVGPPVPRDDCEAALKAEGIRFSTARLGVQKRKTMTCGSEQVIVYHRSAAGIAYDPPAMLTCNMALALSRLDAVVQEEAKRAFGKRIVRIHQLGTFACREMKAYPGWVSEHSYANAIDLETFTLEDGKVISVLRHFDKADAPAKAEGRFLRQISQRAYDENLFSNVLTPFFDALHRNHFHIDLGRYRTDGTRG